MMNEKQIKELMNAFDKSALSELKVEKDDFKLSLSKNVLAPVFAPVLNASNRIEQAPQVQENIVEVKNSNIIDVKSPMVGTFYSSPNPTSKPFVSIGDTVKKGSTLGIIEAMKIMNEVEADFDMKIIKIIAQNNGAVEFDMTMFEVEKV